MKVISWLVLSLALCLATGLATPVAARPGYTTCVDYLLDQTVPDDLVVPAGGPCVLINVSVRGNVRVHQGSGLQAVESRLTSTLVMRGTGELALLCGTTVESDARFAEHRGGLLIGDLPFYPGYCGAHEVWGNLRVHHNDQADIIVANTTIGKNLICTANDPAPIVYGNTVKGKARGQCGDGAPVDAAELGDGAE